MRRGGEGDQGAADRIDKTLYLAVTEDEKFVYVQNAVSGTVYGFRVEADGALTKITTAEGLPAFDESGIEGIAAV
ncbi:hypothetical protein [Streptomyces coeruleorubidus]